MPLQNPGIFESTNDFYQIVPGAIHGKGERVFGICVANSLLWCKKMLSGTRDLLSKPSYREAEMLQAIYNQYGEKNGYGDDATTYIMSRVGVSGRKIKSSVSSRVGLQLMAFEPATYFTMNDEHAIAFRVKDGRYYFYDCDENGAGGLFLYQDRMNWMQKVENSGYPSNDKWEIWSITL